MKIKFKITLGISSILIILGIVLNISIRNVLLSNLEKSVNSSLSELMNSTRETIKYRLTIDDSLLKEDLLRRESEYLIKYISLNYECRVEIQDMTGNTYSSNINDIYEEIENGMSIARTGQAIINLKYTSYGMLGILSYPIYINNRYLGILTLAKNYDSSYFEYIHTANFLTLIEIIIFIIIFLLCYFITNRTTRPISSLTSAVKEIGNGNYDISISTKGTDEVAILSQEFINMKDKIQEQITTINAEKDKVFTLEKSRKQFFDNVTHEIKTPLTSISGYAEMIKDNITDDEEFKKRAIERIYSESERLHLLVLDLIDVSKGISNVQSPPDKIYMYPLIKQICEDMNIKAEKYNLKILYNLEIGSINGHQNKIRELLINILDNAIKHSIGIDDILVNSYIKENYYYIEIINKAVPIPDKIYNSIFDPFVKSPKSKELQSSGLGLYLCNEIIKEHFGEISIQNGETIIVKIKIPCF